MCVEDGVVEVGEDLMTGRPGVFAGGDIVPAERTVTMAIGHGRTAAGHVDAWLRGDRLPPSSKVEIAEIRRAEHLVLRRRAEDRPPTARRARAASRRSTRSYAASTSPRALFEARRCLSCGTCFACDNCYGVCPDNAVIKLDPAGSYAYAFDLDYCKGCGLCAQECPCGAIEMEPETI